MDVILSGAKDVLSRESGFTVSRTPRCRQLHEVGHGGAPNAPKDIRGRRTTARTRRRTLRTCSMLVSAPCPTNPDLFLWDTRSGRHEKRPERRSFKSFLARCETTLHPRAERSVKSVAVSVLLSVSGPRLAVRWRARWPTALSSHSDHRRNEVDPFVASLLRMTIQCDVRSARGYGCL